MVESIVFQKLWKFEIAEDYSRVLIKLKNDATTAVIMKDEMILRYGSDLLGLHYDTDRMAKSIRAKLREIADFLILLRIKVNSVNGSLRELMSARNWDCIVQATREVKFDEKKLKIGHMITKIASELSSRGVIERKFGILCKIYIVLNCISIFFCKFDQKISSN